MSYDHLPKVTAYTADALVEGYGAECVAGESPEAPLQAMVVWLQQEQAALRDANPELARLIAYFCDDYHTLIAGMPLTLRQRAWLDVANSVGLYMSLSALDVASHEFTARHETPNRPAA
jgi:hypothetical protein